MYQKLLLLNKIAMAEARRNAVVHETLLVRVHKTLPWHSLWHLMRIEMHLVLDGNIMVRITVMQ